MPLDGIVWISRMIKGQHDPSASNYDYVPEIIQFLR